MENMKQKVEMFNTYFKFNVEVPAMMPLIPVIEGDALDTDSGGLTTFYREDREYCQLQLNDDEDGSYVVMFEEISSPEDLLKKILNMIPDVNSFDEAKALLLDDDFWLDLEE